MAQPKVVDPPFYDPPMRDYDSGQQHSQAWTEYHQTVADKLNDLNKIAVGVIDGSDAPAGEIGEYLSASLAGPVSLGNFAAANVGSLSLTAGDWDVWGAVRFTPAGSTTVNAIFAWVNTVSAAVPAWPGGGYAVAQGTLKTGGEQILPTGTARLTLTATTPVYLGAMAGFAASTMAATGFIAARRVR